MQFGRAPHHTILEIGDNDGAVVGALFGIALDKTVIHLAIEAIAAARTVKPQQMIAQQRQFFVLAKRPDVAPGTRPAHEISVVHVQTPLRLTLEEASNP